MKNIHFNFFFQFRFYIVGIKRFLQVKKKVIETDENTDIHNVLNDLLFYKGVFYYFNNVFYKKNAGNRYCIYSY